MLYAAVQGWSALSSGCLVDSFRFSKKKADTTDETLAEIMARLEALQGQIPGLTYIKCHRGLPSERPVVWTFLLDSTLERADQLPGYIAHPAHVAVNEFMSPFLESRAVIDYEA